MDGQPVKSSEEEEGWNMISFMSFEDESCRIEGKCVRGIEGQPVEHVVVCLRWLKRKANKTERKLKIKYFDYYYHYGDDGDDDTEFRIPGLDVKSILAPCEYKVS